MTLMTVTMIHTNSNWNLDIPSLRNKTEMTAKVCSFGVPLWVFRIFRSASHKDLTILDSLDSTLFSSVRISRSI